MEHRSSWMLWARCSNANPSLMRDDQKHHGLGYGRGRSMLTGQIHRAEDDSSSAKSMRRAVADALCSPVEDAQV
jgi:hypothetical protein